MNRHAILVDREPSGRELLEHPGSVHPDLLAVIDAKQEYDVDRLLEFDHGVSILNYRQRLFIEHDLGESSVSTVDVARRAGYPWPEQMARKMLRNVEKRGVQAARNGPSEDSKCWQRIELGIHGLKSWGCNWPRKVRETRTSSSHQCLKKNRCRSLRFSIPTISPASHSPATGHWPLLSRDWPRPPRRLPIRRKLKL